MSKKVYLTKEFTFDAAHYLPNYDGKCNNLHGHTYKLQVTVSGYVQPYIELFDEEKILDKTNANDFMVIDFGELKKIVKDKIMVDHDHANLNETYIFPTAEVMSITIYDRIKKELPKGVTLESIKLWETPTCIVEYKGE